MAKTTGKLKYDLSLTSTTEFDATAVYINKSAELGVNGLANLEYRTIGATYSLNYPLLPTTGANLLPGPSAIYGKAYLYCRNLGPANGANIKLSFSNVETNDGITGATGNGIPGTYDPNQFADLAVNEFCFVPVALGASFTNIYARAGWMTNGANWLGATYSQIEYMITYTIGNTIGPNY
jgi:hypothetical protein